MSDDNLQAELEVLARRRAAIKEDLAKLGAQMSAASNVVLLMHIAILDNDIRDLKQNLEDMGFEDFMRKAWGSDDKFR